MKKYLFSAFLVLIVSGAFAQLGLPYSKSAADATFVKKSDLIDGNAILKAKADTAGQAYTGAQNFTGATITAATKAVGDNSLNVATTAFALNAANLFRQSMVNIGIPCVGVPLFSSVPWNSSAPLNDGRMVGNLIYFNEPTVITGFKYMQNTTGDYTADNTNEIVLASVSGYVPTVVSGGRTANDGNLWKTTTNTVATKALPSPITVQPGLYAIMALWNASATTTIPSIYQFGACGITNVNSVKLSFFRNGQSSIASTEDISTAAGNTNIWAIWVY